MLSSQELRTYWEILVSDRRSRNKISMRNYDQVVCNIGSSYIFSLTVFHLRLLSHIWLIYNCLCAILRAVFYILSTDICMSLVSRKTHYKYNPFPCRFTALSLFLHCGPFVFRVKPSPAKSSDLSKLWCVSELHRARIIRRNSRQVNAVLHSYHPLSHVQEKAISEESWDCCRPSVISKRVRSLSNKVIQRQIKTTHGSMFCTYAGNRAHMTVVTIRVRKTLKKCFRPGCAGFSAGEHAHTIK